MAYERYGRGDDDGRRDDGRDGGRGYYGAGERGGYGREGASSYGRRSYGGGSYGQGDSGQRGDDRGGYDRGGYGQGSYGRDTYSQGGYGQSDYGRQDYGQRDYGASDYGRDYGQRQERGAWGGQDRQRFTGGDSYYRPNQSRDDGRGRGDDARDRGFFERAGDEVRSWFGDEEAERRREQDARAAERADRARDAHYHDWRDQQIASFDRDYDEYRQENRQKFHTEFSSWRSARQGQRDLLGQLKEHAEVVGSNGAHVGTVDKVRGDRVILTKSDPDAGGRHHSFPSSWLQSVDGGKATLNKSAAEAKQHWQDEERQGAMFGGNGQQADANGQTAGQTGGTDLNRSFSGTY